MDLNDLRSRLSTGRLFHAYIVTGGDDGARERAGTLIASAAVCSGAGSAPCGLCRDCRKVEKGVHPDVEVLRKDKTAREYAVDALRALRARASVLPNEAERSVYIITEADAMNVQAQNAMLKIFEEPPRHAVFVLLAANPERLLETVRSRCETVNLAPLDSAPEGPAADTARDIVGAFVAGDSMALVRGCLAVEKLGRTELTDMLTALRLAALEEAAGGRLAPERLDVLEEAAAGADKMSQVNVSATHIAGLLLASLVRK